ncbi:DUF2946 domain-containing protein [Caballeronia sp. TF1N1]|uniref:DUF2946 domain-containing protein n=1 Tax=Caballeronia sp. TF1N1 TaxID=2878153 RepID=UPI001FD53A5E|nr:DUF2946 domain-containing protein [Caballeronia sp. TF1N1]
MTHRDMQSRFFRTWCSLLGLLAILMATLAPTVSQLVVAARMPAMTMDADCPMERMQSMSDDADHASHSHTTMPDGQACGYCGLLAHVPFIPGLPVSFAVTARTIAQLVATRFVSTLRIEPRTSRHARAPPAFS